MVQIVPAILTNDSNELREKLEALDSLVERVQIDIIDGVYAANKTILPDALAEIETNLLIDFHLDRKSVV